MRTKKKMTKEMVYWFGKVLADEKHNYTRHDFERLFNFNPEKLDTWFERLYKKI